jgi:hypothetical protein
MVVTLAPAIVGHLHRGSRATISCSTPVKNVLLTQKLQVAKLNLEDLLELSSFESLEVAVNWSPLVW